MWKFLAKRDRGDGRSPNPSAAAAGAKTQVVNPQRERAFSAALERAVITLMLIAGILSGGFLFLWEFLARIGRIAGALGIAR